MESLGKPQMQQKRDLQLVLFPCPLEGHINPMLQLAKVLHSKGFSITIVHTSFNPPNSSNYPDFTFIPIPDGISDTQDSTDDVITLLTLVNENCVEPLKDCLARMLSDDSEEPIPCMISDAMMHFTQSVANSLKLPRIVLRTTSVISFLLFAAFPTLRQKGYLPISSDSQLESPVPEFPPLKVKDLPVINLRNRETPYQLVASMVNETEASSGLIWNTFDQLEQSALAALRQEFQIRIFPIGPFHKLFPASSSSLLMQDHSCHSCIAWLDTQAPSSVIYVSFGSIASLDEAEFAEMAWGLANSKHPFLWVVRPGSVRGSKWIETLSDGFQEMISGRGCIVKWAPQQEVLAHPAVGGFWTHNGWNSTLESICEGEPMLCRPCFGDQLVNARYVSNVWRVGLHLEELERGEIEKAIRRLMVCKEGKEIREGVMNFKKKVDLCLRKGGSSYESLESLIAYILSF